MKKEDTSEKFNKDPKIGNIDEDFDHDRIIKELDLSNNFPTGYMILYR